MQSHFDDVDQYKDYLCACLNNMDICYRQTQSWAEEVEDRLESKNMMIGRADDIGSMNTERLNGSFRQISDAAVWCLRKLIMAEVRPPGSLRPNI